MARRDTERQVSEKKLSLERGKRRKKLRRDDWRNLDNGLRSKTRDHLFDARRMKDA